MNEEIRVLSLWQPWASLVAWGIKKWETRNWPTSYHGRLAIASTKTQPSNPRIELDRIWQESGLDSRLIPFIEAGQMPQGCIVAIAFNMRCHRMTEDNDTIENKWINLKDVGQLEKACGDWQADRYGFKLLDVVKTDPIPFKGGQGLREVKDENLKTILQSYLNNERTT